MEKLFWVVFIKFLFEFQMSSHSSRYNTRSGASSDKSQDEDIGSISSATPQTQQPDCDYCPKSFRGRQYYLNHLSTDHAQEAGVKERRHHCNICGRDYANNSALKNHVCRPQGEKQKRKPKQGKASTSTE